MKLASIALAAALAAGAPALAAQTPVDLPAPPNVLATLPEADLLAQLTDAERGAVGAARDARTKFDVLLDISDRRLADLASGASGHGAPLVFAIQTYEAIVLAADRRIRSPEAAARPRDRVYKRYEKRLAHQLDILKDLGQRLTLEEDDAGRAALDTVTRLRIAAFNSAIDADSTILAPPETKP